MQVSYLVHYFQQLLLLFIEFSVFQDSDLFFTVYGCICLVPILIIHSGNCQKISLVF